MALLIVLPGREEEASRLAADFREIDETLDIRLWPDVGLRDDVDMVVAWNHPKGLLNSFPNLRLVASFGAGVEHLLDDPALPEGVEIVRTVDSGLAFGMAEYVVTAVADWRRGWGAFREAQRLKTWSPRSYALNGTVLVLGIGRMGWAVARALQSVGHRVVGWKRTGGSVDGVECISGRRALKEALADVDVVVCLLPLTVETEGMLDCDFFASMKKGSLLVNVGRGAHLNEDDLIAALAEGRPGHAVLDVFREEPLPLGHSFWTHPAITVTPHVASLTDPRGAAERIAENRRRLNAGEPLLDPVERERGY